jgi:hypothetical protein
VIPTYSERGISILPISSNWESTITAGILGNPLKKNYVMKTTSTGWQCFCCIYSTSKPTRQYMTSTHQRVNVMVNIRSRWGIQICRSRINVLSTHQHINLHQLTHVQSSTQVININTNSDRSTHQHINTSTHQHINTVINTATVINPSKHINTVTNTTINTSTQCHQQINTVINTSTHQHIQPSNTSQHNTLTPNTSTHQHINTIKISTHVISTHQLKRVELMYDELLLVWWRVGYCWCVDFWRDWCVNTCSCVGALMCWRVCWRCWLWYVAVRIIPQA